LQGLARDLLQIGAWAEHSTRQTEHADYASDHRSYPNRNSRVAIPFSSSSPQASPDHKHHSRLLETALYNSKRGEARQHSISLLGRYLRETKPQNLPIQENMLRDALNAEMGRVDKKTGKTRGARQKSHVGSQPSNIWNLNEMR